MKTRFEPTKFEDKTMPNTMATLPGPSLATKRPKMIYSRLLNNPSAGNNYPSGPDFEPVLVPSRPRIRPQRRPKTCRPGHNFVFVLFWFRFLKPKMATNRNYNQ